MSILFASVFIFAILLGIFSMIFIEHTFSVYLFMSSMIILIISLISAPLILQNDQDNIPESHTINKDSIIIKDSILIIYNNDKIKAFKIN